MFRDALVCVAIDDHASATSFICLVDRNGNQLLPIAGFHLPNRALGGFASAVDVRAARIQQDDPEMKSSTVRRNSGFQDVGTDNVK